MTEEEARGWVVDHFGVPRETLLERFAGMVVEENSRQNLVSADSLPMIWRRHIVDSAQLVGLASNHPGTWIDVGTGAGFPGMVVALLTERPMVLIEPRRRRADFLIKSAQQLGIGDRVTVVASRAARHAGSASVISARAVAALPELFAETLHLSSKNTLWLLPKGSRALEEVEAARRTWHGVFHVEQSITEPGSLIITAKDVARR